ncbi:hypothetical protein [Novosphingobium sp. PhB165]|uniref:hypothetical protein n=1 Tax=Novosphingobium sp. PhB165 TaxID=2485105 RepID=UPI0014051D55|nr:hypothetical protein [Novosphingobium sp. PhB165]
MELARFVQPPAVRNNHPPNSAVSRAGHPLRANFSSVRIRCTNASRVLANITSVHLQPFRWIAKASNKQIRIHIVNLITREWASLGDGGISCAIAICPVLSVSKSFVVMDDEGDGLGKTQTG